MFTFESFPKLLSYHRTYTSFQMSPLANGVCALSVVARVRLAHANLKRKKAENAGGGGAKPVLPLLLRRDFEPIMFAAEEKKEDNNGEASDNES